MLKYVNLAYFSILYTLKLVLSLEQHELYKRLNIAIYLFDIIIFSSSTLQNGSK